MVASRLNLREFVRALTHLVEWVDYHSGGETQPSRRPARLTFYASSRSVGASADLPAKGDAA